MEVRVLGAVEIVGETLNPKERALLCRLVIAAGRVVRTDDLITALWPDRAPPTMLKTLQGNVLRLRRALAAAQKSAPTGQAVTVVSGGGGYMLVLSDPMTVDVTTFDAHIEGARRAQSRRDHDVVVSMLRDALRQWRGTPFGEFSNREWASGERWRLEERCVAAREDLMEAELALGRHHAMVAELELMVTSEPLRERAWEQLALALYRCGRQADGLHAIQRARSVLRDELGVEPGPGLKALEQAILVHDESLALEGSSHDGAGHHSRRMVSFLFADVGGEPRRMPPDSGALVAQNIQERELRAAIDAGGGDVFSVVDGAVRAVFPTASAAIEAAAVAGRSWSAGDDRRQMRMAVSTGEAEVVNGEWTGGLLQRCAQLLGSGDAGQILVSDATARLANVAIIDMQLIALGERRVPDADVFEDVFELVVPAAEDRVGPTGLEPGGSVGVRGSDVRRRLPASLARHLAPIWVGREGELERLRSSWDLASRGTFRMLLIAGEPGAGKTGLAAQFGAESAADGALVLYGRCTEGAVVPYRAFAEVLDQLVSSADGTLLAEHASRHGGDLCWMVPRLGRRVFGLRPLVPTTPEADRNRLTSATVGLLTAGADRRPLIIVFDDLQWADAGTAGLLRELVHQAPETPLLVIATYRNTDIQGQQPAAQLLVDLRREPGVDRVGLTGLGDDDVWRLLQLMAGRPLDEDAAKFASSLHSDTAGNPFFIIEVLRHLTETGQLRLAERGWFLASLPPSIPEGVRDVVGRRLDRFDRGTIDALRAASVIGPVFELRVLADVLDSDPDQVLGMLESVGDAHLVSEVVGEIDCWQFTHELVRRTLLDQLSAGRRTRLHRTVARSIERTSPNHLAALALHFTAAAGLGEAERAIRYALAAADQAAASAAHADAARLIEEAMEAADAANELDDDQRGELLTRIGAEKARAGDGPAAAVCLDRAIDLARRHRSNEALAAAVLARASYGWSYHGDSDERRLIIEALAVGPHTPTTQARLLTAHARMGAMGIESVDRKRADVAAAVAAARAIGDPETIGGALLSSAYLGCGPDDINGRMDLLGELVAAAKAAHRPDWEAMALGFRTDCHLMLGEYDEARAAEAEHERIAVTSRDPFAAVTAGETAGRRACLNGDFERAEMMAAEQMDLGARIGISPQVMELSAAGIYLPVWNLQGRLDEIEGILNLIPDAGEWRQLRTLWTASLRARQGRFDDAEDLLGPGMPWIEHGRGWGAGVEDATTAIVHLRDSARAESLLKQLEPHHRLDCVLNCVQYRGAVVHHIGRLLTICGRHPEAIKHLRHAYARYVRLGSPPWQVLARCDLARALRGRASNGDVEKADQLQGQAAQEAVTLKIISTP